MLVALARERGLAPAMQPHFAVCFRGRLSQELRMAGGVVDYLGEVRVSRPFSVQRARRALRTLLAQEKIDVAVCHLPWAHAIFAPVLQTSGIPVVFWMHGFATGRHWTERWAALTRPTLVIANSHATAQTAPRLFAAAPVTVLYAPVTLSPEPRAEVPGLIVQASRLEPWKGHRLLLEALALLKDLPAWTCRVIGGPQTSAEERYLVALHERASRLGLGNRVEFLGQRSDVESQLAAASVFCQPNTGPEPFGIAMIEALAAGVPVVATGLGAAPEIVDGTCGLLCEPANPADLARALRMLFGDLMERGRLAAGAQARAAALCSPAKQLPALALLLQKVTLNRQSQ